MKPKAKKTAEQMGVVQTDGFWHGRAISFETLPPDIFSTWCECLMKFMRRLGSLKLYVSWGPCRFYVSIIFLVPLCASILEALCLGCISIKFEVFHRGFPSYRGLIRFSCRLGGENSWHGNSNIISDPSPKNFISVFQLCIGKSWHIGWNWFQKNAGYWRCTSSRLWLIISC